MSLELFLSVAGGIVSLLSATYFIIKHINKLEFKIDELWTQRNENEESNVKLAILESKINDIHTFIWNRAKEEASLNKTFVVK